MIQHRLKQIDLGLQKIALGLRDEEARRKPHFEAPLLDVEPLTRHRLAGTSGLDSLCGAVHLPHRLTQRLTYLELKAGDALRSLPPLDLSARQPCLFEAAA